MNDLPNEPRTTLMPQEIGFLKLLTEKTDLSKLRHGLSAALLFSPIYLLVKKKVTGNAWSQPNMVLVRGSMIYIYLFLYFGSLLADVKVS